MAKSKPKTIRAILDARPDTFDFRDKMYVPTLVEVPTHIPLSDFQDPHIPVLNQGAEGACTGFGLATVANYLLTRRKVIPDPVPVSPRMLYEMAKRYDEWPGESYSGSSARGAMKGWYKHGVCPEADWPYHPKKVDKSGLNDARTAAAKKRPLGAYFRVNHKDLVAMHSAIAEVKVLYATATVHEGWYEVGTDGKIPFPASEVGGHAFAIVAYDADGFWIQNSWGTGWGKAGFGCITYDDWLTNGTDVWVARLGAPVTLRESDSAATAHSASAGQSVSYSYPDLRPHIVSLGNNGKLEAGGDYGTSPVELAQIFEDDIPRAMAGWKKKHLLLYAHGGLVEEQTAVQRLADYRKALLEAQVYPISFIWHSGFWTTITNIIQDAIRRRRPEGVLDAAKDFMLDRLDDALEPLARTLTGKLLWDEMKENALAASKRGGGARLALDHLASLQKRDPSIEVHVLGHSAGSIFHAPLVRLLTSNGPISSGYLKGEKGYGMKISTCTLWAPACTIDLFKQAYLSAIQKESIERFALFVLNDKAEQDDDCAGIYHKSLLYMVSNALEQEPRIPGFMGGEPVRDGVPMLGLQKFIEKDKQLQDLFGKGKAQLVVAPNDEAQGSMTSSQARHHGDFDDDPQTLQATLAHILGSTTKAKEVSPSQIHRSATSLRDRRLQIDRTTQVQPQP